MVRSYNLEKEMALKLSPRQVEVLLLVEQGFTNSDIADYLHPRVLESTVKKCLKGVRAKLGTSGRMNAVARARELNLLPELGARDDVGRSFS